MSIYVNHAGRAGSVPFLVRVIPLISLPVFVLIFVFEQGKWLAYSVGAPYFGASSFILLFGARGTIFRLAVARWYVARIKSRRRAHRDGGVDDRLQE